MKQTLFRMSILERHPRLLLREAPVALLRIARPSRILTATMAYYLVIYCLLYFLSVSNPLIDMSMRLRGMVGFEPLQVVVTLNECAAFNSTCSVPPNSSNYVLAVLASYFSVMKPKLSVAYALFTLTLLDFLQDPLKSALRKLTGSIRLSSNAYAHA